MFAMRSFAARRLGPASKLFAVFSLLVFLSATGPLAAAPLELPLTGSEVALTAGGSIRLPLTSEALGWLPGLSEIRTVSDPPAPYPISAGLSEDGSRLFLAVPPTMPPGRYTVRISALAAGGAKVTGTVTLVAQGLLNVAGQDFDLTPFWNDVLLFSSDSSSNAIDVSASGGHWEGLIMALNGRVQIQGSEGSGGLEIVASIIADQVHISGSNFSLNGLLEVIDGPKHIRLVE